MRMHRYATYLWARCPRADSNCHYRLRRLAFYPLNYEDIIYSSLTPPCSVRAAGLSAAGRESAITSPGNFLVPLRGTEKILSIPDASKAVCSLVPHCVRAAGNRTRSAPSRRVCTTGILQPVAIFLQEDKPQPASPLANSHSAEWFHPVISLRSVSPSGFEPPTPAM